MSSEVGRLRVEGFWDQARIARHHLPVSMVLMLAGVVYLLAAGTSYGVVLASAAPIALGGFVVLIIGTSRLLLSELGGIRVAGRGVAAYLPTVLVVVGSLGAFLGLASDLPVGRYASSAWGLGLILHVAFVGRSISRSGARPQGTIPSAKGLLLAATLCYGAAAAVALPLASLGVGRWLGGLHLLLPGFVVLCIISVVVFVLPTFSGTELPEPVVWSLAVPGAIGPGAIAAGFNGVPWLLVAGAGAEVLTLLGIGAGLIMSAVRARPWRSTHLLYAFAGSAVFAGGCLGFAISTGWLDGPWIPLHGLLNLLGFVGGVVLAASLDLYMPEAVSGPRQWGLHASTLVVSCGAGLVLLLSSVWTGTVGMTLAVGCYGLAILLQLAGSLTRGYPVAGIHGTTR